LRIIPLSVLLQVVVALLAMLACSAWAAPSGLLGTTIIGARGVITGIPVATSSLVAGPSCLIASKDIAPVGVAAVGLAPLGLGLGGHVW